MADWDGSHCSSMAKIAMRNVPLTNSGRPMNASEPTEIRLSAQVFLRSAASNPRKIPSGTYMANATSASMKLLRSRSNTTGRTAVAMLGDSPQSPRT